MENQQLSIRQNYDIGDKVGIYTILSLDSKKCSKCGKIQEQSMSNMKVHKKETCTYCKYPDYSPATHKGGGGSVKLSFDERFYNYYKSRIDGWNKSPNRKYKEWKLSICI